MGGGGDGRAPGHDAGNDAGGIDCGNGGIGTGPGLNCSCLDRSLQTAAHNVGIGNMLIDSICCTLFHSDRLFPADGGLGQAIRKNLHLLAVLAADSLGCSRKSAVIREFRSHAGPVSRHGCEAANTYFHIARRNQGLIMSGYTAGIINPVSFLFLPLIDSLHQAPVIPGQALTKTADIIVHTRKAELAIWPCMILKYSSLGRPGLGDPLQISGPSDRSVIG